MEIIWGYSPEKTLDFTKEIGEKVIAVKQVFAALLFKTGIKGICTKIDSFKANTSVNIELDIDSVKVFEEKFYPNRAKIYYFELPEVIKPKLKIEVLLNVENGYVTLPLSSIGTGMGFQKTDQDFQPTNHLALGLLIP